MTALRQRMIEDMQLHSFADRTQGSYLRVVRQLAEYFNKPPDQISEDELRQYFLYLKNVKKVCAQHVSPRLYAGSSSSTSAHYSGIGPHWIWCARRRRRSCRWCSVWRKYARFWPECGVGVTGYA